MKRPPSTICPPFLRRLHACRQALCCSLAFGLLTNISAQAQHITLQASKSAPLVFTTACLDSLTFNPITEQDSLAYCQLFNSAATYVSQYRLDHYLPQTSLRLDSIVIDQQQRSLTIYAGEAFCAQPHTPTLMNNAYSRMRSFIPPSLQDYAFDLRSNRGVSLTQLVPNLWREPAQRDLDRQLNQAVPATAAWVRFPTWQHLFTNSLLHRHLFVSPSHGIVFRNNVWKWQRPNLYCTNEDLLTQSIVFPYLVPMLENAGAVVFTPRERDYQTTEIIVDSDNRRTRNGYKETRNADYEWHTYESGFAYPDTPTLTDSINPFTLGTSKFTTTTSSAERSIKATWTPDIPADGNYAIYVSYHSFPNSATDAHYTIHLLGTDIPVRINQQMGGDTWTYLGTYPLRKGDETKVTLTNESATGGVVSADALKVGGGMGIVNRDSVGTSGYPRYLEAARYQAAWCGLPDSLIRSSNPSSDYTDDIRVRGNWANYLAGGSPYRPTAQGLRVPIELSIALHTDAGVRYNNRIYGTLGICTAFALDSLRTYPSHLSRLASADLAGLLIDRLSTDLTKAFKLPWTRREQWDRNYGETRMPDVPSAIVELLSHQNFKDLTYAFDPNFKFQVARSLYATLAEYVNALHGLPCPVIQPLPVRELAAILTETPDDKALCRLSWQPTTDSIQGSPIPTRFIVYTRTDDAAYDNGKLVEGLCQIDIPIDKKKRYDFKVVAVNPGGMSFPSEELSVYYAGRQAKQVLIVNAFERLSGPAQIACTDSLGFRLDVDAGVAYGLNTVYCGQQLQFNPQRRGEEGPGACGYSGNELAGQAIAGNTFNFVAEHGRAIAAAGNYSYSSISRSAFDRGTLPLAPYAVIDYLAGLQGRKPHNLRPYPVLSDAGIRSLTIYLNQGGRLFISGSYVAADLHQHGQRAFLNDHLHAQYDGAALIDSTALRVSGLRMEFPLIATPNPTHYEVSHPDAIYPASEAFAAFIYGSQQGAGVAYKGAYRTLLTAFPFECIDAESTRNKAMKAILRFLTE